MSYISYFDLLGTRGFCENSKVYYENIKSFYETVQQLSCFLYEEHGGGKVGIFSDCAYAESPNLNHLLTFMVEVRDRLIAKGLFFNAVIKEGNLNIDKVEHDDLHPSFGVVFNDSNIADLFITQSKFKGIGIWIEPKLVSEVKTCTNFHVNKCFYLEKKNEAGNITVNPVKYYDISFSNDGYQKEIEHTLDIFLRQFYAAYIKSPKFGMYYISAFCNFLRSSNTTFEWDYKNNDFKVQPLEFKSIEKILKSEELSDLAGIEYLALVMLDIVYNTNINNSNLDIKSYTKKIISIDCVKNRFIHYLNEIPQSIFSDNNRSVFINYCQEDLSNDFVENIFNE